MPEDDFYTPTDLDALRMENELLAFEVQFLKAKYADPKRHIAEAERSVDELKERLAKCHQNRESLQERLNRAGLSPQRKEELLKAEQSLTVLLKLISSSPFAWFFRRKKEFRELEQRHLQG